MAAKKSGGTVKKSKTMKRTGRGPRSAPPPPAAAVEEPPAEVDHQQVDRLYTKVKKGELHINELQKMNVPELHIIAERDIPPYPNS